MFSFASVRYRNILEADGGPIASLETISVKRRGIDGFEANARLREHLAPPRSSVLFAATDGSGAAPFASVARHKAISEAIERWALLEGLIAGRGENWGLGTDPTSTGFAAFPGAIARQARRFAWLEAAERWCLFAWWEGILPGEPISLEVPEVEALRICGPFLCKVIVVHSESEPGVHAYGYAAGTTIAEASGHALTEMDRLAVALRGRSAIGTRSLSQHEARALYFSNDEGFKLFADRRTRSFRMNTVPSGPGMAFDREIPGAWSRYASVWRVVFEPPSHRFLNDGRDYFWW